jgi:hypothetical protein
MASGSTRSRPLSPAARPRPGMLNLRSRGRSLQPTGTCPSNPGQSLTEVDASISSAADCAANAQKMADTCFADQTGGVGVIRPPLGALLAPRLLPVPRPLQVWRQQDFRQDPRTSTLASLASARPPAGSTTSTALPRATGGPIATTGPSAWLTQRVPLRRATRTPTPAPRRPSGLVGAHPTASGATKLARKCKTLLSTQPVYKPD